MRLEEIRDVDAVYGHHARIATRIAGRELRDGDIATACEAACPAGAIVFGDINEPSSRVAHAFENDRRYKLLGELGTQPRTTYLAKIRNPNPRMATATANHGAGE